MEKSILKNWDDPFYHAVDPRCRYWLLTPNKSKDSEKKIDDFEKAVFIEGAIRIPMGSDGSTIIWEPISASTESPSYVFTYENFIKLLQEVHALERVVPEYILSEKQEYFIFKEYIDGNTYIEHSIPSTYSLRGGVKIYTFCEDKETWEEILNESYFEEK